MMLDNLEALRIYASSFRGQLIEERDFTNAIRWVLNGGAPWKFQLYKIKSLASYIQVEF